tara:strand:- start:1631 stop:1894 length:264 start_codon:yes stop_codon:yes gene_type:complete
MAKAEKAKTITKKELQEIQEQTQKHKSFAESLGVLQIENHRILRLSHELLDQMGETREKLEKKYGAINIDISTGSYEIIDIESKLPK